MNDEPITYVIVYKHTHKEDRYEEDDYGREIHYLDGDTTVNFKEVKGIGALHNEVEGIGESNADNPPYDEYHVVLVYEKETKKILPEHWWYSRNEDEE